MSQKKLWWDKDFRGQYVCEICGEYIKERKGEERVNIQKIWISTIQNLKKPPIARTHVHKKCLENENVYVLAGQRCPILPNYHTDKSSRCVRYISCYIQERTEDPNCPAKDQK